MDNKNIQARKMVAFRLPVKLNEELNKYAYDQRMTKTGVIEIAIQEFLEREKWRRG